MSRSLILSFNSALAKYSRLNKKVRKSISKGEFWRFTKRKRHHLLARIEKLRRRLTELRTQIKFAGVGIAAAAILSATSAEAQKTTVGPFVNNPARNPLPPPAFISVFNSQVSFFDLNGDHALDALLSYGFEGHTSYLNSGNKNFPGYAYDYNTAFALSIPGPESENNWLRTALADIDNDGDFDMVVTVSQGSEVDNEPDYVAFYRNSGDGTYSGFYDDGGNNPFGTFSAIRNSWPSFADIDSDGDQDLVLSGYFYDDAKGEYEMIQYFRNDQTDKTPGVDPVFTPLTGNNNPLYFPYSSGYSYLGITFGDLDEDGDPDMVYYSGDGKVHYKRNDKGTFVEQTGNWTFNTQDKSATTGNPFKNIDIEDLGATDDYVSIALADLDGDGDLDATYSINVIDITPSANGTVFVENTGHGVFQYTASAVNILTGIAVGSDANSAFFDYDGDGDKDIVATSTTYLRSDCAGGSCESIDYSIVPTVFLNDDGKYTQQTIGVNTFPTELPSTGSAKWVDADGDGDLDLLIMLNGSQNDGSVEVLYYENEDGQYNQKVDENNPFNFISGTSYYSFTLDLADLDNDGLPDLILNKQNHDPEAYQNKGTKDDPDFEFESSWSDGFTDTGGYKTAPDLVDIDNDGDYDIIVGKYGGGMWFYENQGDKTEPEFHLYYNSQGEGDDSGWARNPFQDFQGSSQLAVPNLADVDGDGDKDMIYIDSDYGTFGFYENQNPAPVVTSERDQPIELIVGQRMALDPQMTLTDADNDNIVKIVATITPYQKGSEKLLIDNEAFLTANFGFSFVWDDLNGVLTITNNTTASNFALALGNIQYLYTGVDGGRVGNTNNGRTISKTITVVTLDSDLTIAPSNTTTFNVGHPNEAPVISPGTFDVTFVSTNVPVLPSITLADTDDQNLVSAKVIFDPSTYKSSEDRLSITYKGDITSVFAESDGILVLTGTSSVANYQAALQSVMYYNASTSATPGTRVVKVTVNDGEVDSNVGTTQISVKGDGTVEPAIYNGMSPNGDGINDWFQIDNAPAGTKVVIYDRWGDSIFESSNYDVTTAGKRFEGKNKKGVEVVAGTYYYKVTIPATQNTKEVTKTGFLLLNR